MLVGLRLKNFLKCISMLAKIKHIQAIIMCKAPVEGRVKTRLMSKYTAQQATALHCAMAKTVIERATRIFKHVCLAVDDINHPFFKSFDLPIYAQGEGDLGERMVFLMERLEKKNEHALLFLGTDSPHMSDKRLCDTAALLQKGYQVVLGAVEDGGYDIIAMKQPYPKLFKGIAWSSDLVLKQTLALIEQAHLKAYVLDTSFDVDTPEMLAKAVDAGWNVTLPHLVEK